MIVVIDIKPSYAQEVTVRVTIERITALGEFDIGGSADFYAIVFVDGTRFNNVNTPETQDDVDDIFSNWPFGRSVDAARGNIPISIQLRDEDGGTRGDADFVDINPGASRNLDLNVNLHPCSVSGDISGRCDFGSFTSAGDEPADIFSQVGPARIQFRVEVFGSAPVARCSHDPIWPQVGNTVSITADALDGSLAPTAADSIGIEVQDVTNPLQTASSTSSLTRTAGPFTQASTFSYRCSVEDNGVTVISPWKTISIGTPPAMQSSRAIPVLLTGPSDAAIDIVFIPDMDSYASGPNNPNFLQAVRDAIREYYRENIFLINQDNLNFWIARDMGDADGIMTMCTLLQAPSNWNMDYTFAEVGGIIHSDAFRDCANQGIMSVQAGNWRVFIHETGHEPFGLADEYCTPYAPTCDGGYFATFPYPNLFEDRASCNHDNLNSNLRLIPCRSFVDPRDGQDWFTTDPIPNDLMVNNNAGRLLDERRIQWMFDECSARQC